MVDPVSQRVIPPRVAFNRLVAVQALERHGLNSMTRTAPSQLSANTRAESMSRINKDTVIHFNESNP